MSHVVVLGAGMVGGVIAADLSRAHQVTVADIDAARLEALTAGVPALETVEADLSDGDAIRRVIEPADLVIGAVPGFLGYAMLEAVIDAGRHLVDISFCAEDPYALDDLARERGVTAIIDCGVAPGICNVILGHHAARFDRVDRYDCLVGGLPQVRTRPYEYKAPFSPVDVIEEYTRPARIMVDGDEVTLPPLGPTELVELPGVGTLEAFDTDGLRTLLRTLEIPNMRERTLRYPGHVELMRVFRDSGFFDEQPIALPGGAQVRPVDVAGALLFRQWRMEPGDADLVVMRVTIEGVHRGQPRTLVYDMLDRYDPATGHTAMARTTGYTCAAAAQLIADGRFTRHGVSAPEVVGGHAGCFEAIRDYLGARGVVFQRV